MGKGQMVGVSSPTALSCVREEETVAGEVEVDSRRGHSTTLYPNAGVAQSA
jgi:hypothetical protein